MDKPLAYRRVEPPPPSLTLEIESDRVRLVVPPSAVWLERVLLLLWSLSMAAQALAWSWIALQLRALAPPGARRSWPFWLFWGAASFQATIIILLIVDHLLFFRVPRRIEMTSGRLDYSRRGLFFGVRFRRYELSRVTGIRVRDDKGLRGTINRRVLIIELGRWRRIHVAFSGEKMPMAAEAEAAFKQMLASNNSGHVV